MTLCISSVVSTTNRMKIVTHQYHSQIPLNRMSNTTSHLPFFGRLFQLVAALACLLAAGLNSAVVQTLKLRFPFDDASGTTTASDTSGGGLAVTLLMENQTAGNAVDMHG